MIANDKFGALIPAAGYSSRMGEFKPLLKLGGRVLIERQIDLFQQIGIESPVVVAGHRADELVPSVEALGARAAINKDFDRGMFTSVQAGLSILAGDGIGAFFMLPVDVPLVPPIVLERMCRVFAKKGPSILYAAADGRRGHPPLINSDLISEILTYGGEGGLRPVLSGHENGAVDFETGCGEILLDMDSPDAYTEIKRRWERSQVPTREACFLLLNEYRTSEDVKAHSERTAELAAAIVTKLNAQGLELSGELVDRAALLHDIAKGKPDHAFQGARILRLHGLETIAGLTVRHMALDYRSGEPLTETEILYLADKLLDGTRLKPLETRRQDALRLNEKKSELRAAIEHRFDEAVLIAAEVDRLTGLPFIRGMELNGSF